MISGHESSFDTPRPNYKPAPIKQQVVSLFEQSQKVLSYQSLQALVMR
jgi:hypothetical protein